MKYAIISDIHANPIALEKVLADVESCGAEQIICAGDVVGYGPDLAGVIRILREREIPTVMGNHDAAVAGLRDTRDMIGSAKHGVDRHRQELSLDDLNWLKSLPYVYEGDGFAVAHANFKNPEGMGYIQDKMDARDSLTRREEEILFVGHTHAPAVFTLGFVSDPYFPDCWQDDHEGVLEMKQNHRYLVNAGSVGYPRVKPCSTYVLFDSISKEVKFREVGFNFYGYADALKAKGISIPCWVEDRLRARGV